MKKTNVAAMWADRIRFEASGRGAKSFLSAAAQAGVHLWKISCTNRGYTACAFGSDLRRLEQMAANYQVDFSLRRRHGPGRILERVAARPGILVGTAAFFLCQWYFGGFLWHIDFGELELPQQEKFRAALAEQGIWEGCRLEEETLQHVRDTLALEMTDEGWLSLNFTAGCLFVEQNQRQEQTVRDAVQPQALYAKAGGQVLEIELESGFPEVTAGQYVAEGQLLANGQKADREGQAVVQGASGSIRGRIQRQYTAVQPLQGDFRLLTGKSRENEQWQLLGYTWTQKEADTFPDGMVTTEWIPFRIGSVALPGAICRTTYWEKTSGTQLYSQQTAKALAARSCRQQLLREFPDAVLESQNLTYEIGESEVICTAEYLFCADMTVPGVLAPLENVQAAS